MTIIYYPLFYEVIALAVRGRVDRYEVVYELCRNQVVT
jgi:hypothetical protein